MIEFWGKMGGTSIDGPKLYSDGTPFLKTAAYDDIIKSATGVTIQARNIAELFAGLAAVRGAKNNGANIKTLILPYIPGARQDRVNPDGDICASLEMVGEMINSCRFNQVLVADPHSPKARVYIENLVEYPLTAIYKHLWKGYDSVIAPDKGGRDRATLAANVLGKPIVYGDKVRDVTNGKLTGFKVDVEAGKHYLVVDDICDGGGTFMGLMEKINEQGAFADLYVTHGIFAKGVVPLLNAGFKSVYTTDTYSNPVADYKAYRFEIVDEMRNYEA